MKRSLIYLLPFLFPTSFVIAQTDFRPGFIITAEKDTVLGEIDYRSNLKNYEGCRFRRDGQTQEFGPHELIGYGYNNDKHYTSGVVEGSFIEVLVDGDLSLYRFGDTYYMRKGAELYKLEAPEEKINVNGKEIKRKSARWKGFVVFLISDCSPGADAINRMRFIEKSLTLMATRYNSCKGSKFAVYKENIPWTHVEMGVGAGLIRSTIPVTCPSWMIHLSDEYETFSPSIGLVLGISSPRLSEKVAFQPEIHFTKSSYSAQVIREHPTYTDYYDTYIDLKTISVPLALRYTLFDGKLALRLLAGINYDFQLEPKSTVIHELVFNNTVTTSEEPAFDIFSNQLGIGGGIMASRVVGKFMGSLVLRYFSVSNMSSSADVVAPTKNLSLSIQLSRK